MSDDPEKHIVTLWYKHIVTLWYKHIVTLWYDFFTTYPVAWLLRRDKLLQRREAKLNLEATAQVRVRREWVSGLRSEPVWAHE